MQNSIVAVVSSARARLFVLESVDEIDSEPGLNFSEVDELHSATQELQGQELWSTTKPGRNRGVGSRAHGYDDHRASHQVEFERRFAREITSKLAQLITTGHPRQLLLVAEPHVMGIMREVLIPHLSKNITLHELTKDLCQLKTHELYQYLVSKALLPIS